MNILYGLYQPDEGEILLDGRRAHFKGPGDAIAAGIGMVHQHFMLVPVVHRRREHHARRRADRHRRRLLDTAPRGSGVARARPSRYGLHVDPDAHGRGPAGRRRSSASRSSRRSTATPRSDPGRADRRADAAGDRRAVRDHARAQATPGKSIIFITHKLREVRAVADRITVMRARQGRSARPSPTATDAELAALMVGRAVLLAVDKTPPTPGDAGAERRAGSRSHDDRGRAAVDGVDSPCAPARSSASPACRATARPSWSRRSPGSPAAVGGPIPLDGRR